MALPQQYDDKLADMRARELLSTIECDSDEGVTIGLIDTIINAAHLLRSRSMASPNIREALRDLSCDRGDVNALLLKAEAARHE